MVEDQRYLIEVVQALDVVYPGARRKARPLRELFVRRDLGKQKDLRAGAPTVSNGGFTEGFDLAQRKGSLPDGAVYIADALALHGLHVSVGDETADGPADSVSGTVVSPDQGVFRGQKFLIGKNILFDLLF